jgi:hypothetical protein
MYDFKDNKKIGDKAESLFKYLCLKNNKEITDSSYYEDKYKHIDFYVRLKQNLKGVLNNDLYYIEITNDYGNPGWIYAEDLQLLAFENFKEFNIYKRKDILKYVEKLDFNKYEIIERKLRYARGGISKCLLLPKKEIEHMKYYTLDKDKTSPNNLLSVGILRND